MIQYVNDKSTIMIIWQDLVLFFFLLFTLLLAWTALTNIFFRVPYVPSKKKVIKEIEKEFTFKKGQKVYDLGCGDARVIMDIEKSKNVEVVGYEISFLVYLMARIRKFLLKSNAKIYFKNFFNVSLKDADVIFCYLGPNTMQKLVKKVKKECKKGTYIISNTFKINDMEPARVLKKDPKRGLPSIYFYKI